MIDLHQITRRPPQAATQPLLIGLGGHKENGKDALADFLVAQHDFEKLGMSDALSQALYTMDPLIPYDGGWLRYQSIVDEVGYVQAKKNSEVRRLLQVLGTEVGRNMLGESVWVDVAARRIAEIRSVGIPVAITGIRYPNELEMIRAAGGYAVWVERPKATTHQGLIVALDTAIASPLETHSSETTLTRDDFDIIVNNDSDLPALGRRATGLVDALTP